MSTRYHLTLPQGSIKVRNHIFTGSKTVAQWSPYNPAQFGGFSDGDTLTVVCTFNLNPDINPKPPASEYVGLCVGACSAQNSAEITAMTTQAQNIYTGTPQSKGILLGSHISTQAQAAPTDIFYGAESFIMPTITLPGARGSLQSYIYRWVMTYNGQNTVVTSGSDVEIVYGYGDPQHGETEG